MLFAVASAVMLPSSPAVSFLAVKRCQQQRLVVGGVPDLLGWIGEADARLVVHVGWSVHVQGCGRVVMVSSHTFALLLHYTP